MSGRDDLFVTAQELSALSDRGRSPIILDVRFQPGQGAQPDEYARGHLPGAVFVDLPRDLASAGGGVAGRFPLPDPGRLERVARDWGIRTGDDVVVYDDRHGLSAARAWWILTWAGLPRVRVLDGGYTEWLHGGHPVSREAPAPRPGDVRLSPGRLGTVDAREVAAVASSGVLIDARTARQYRGESGPPPGGHIPGAVNVSSRDALDAAGLLLEDGVLRERYGAVGALDAARVAAYCGGGVVGAHTVLVLASLGIDADLYVGSWSAWSADPRNAIATGPGSR